MMCILSSATSFPASTATTDSDQPQYSSDGSSSPDSRASSDSLSESPPVLEEAMGSSASKQDQKNFVQNEECSNKTALEKSDIASNEMDGTASLKGWRRLLVKAGEKWSVQFVSPDGQTRFESHEDMMEFIQKNNINASELHFLSEDEEETPLRRAIPLTFCNMRANILDMRKRKCRKRSQGSRQGSIDISRRKSSTTSDDEPPEKMPVGERLSSIDERLEEQTCTKGNEENALNEESQMVDTSKIEQFDNAPKSPDPAILHVDAKEDLDGICDSKENDRSILNAVSNEKSSLIEANKQVTASAKSFLAIPTSKPESHTETTSPDEEPTETTAEEPTGLPSSDLVTEVPSSVASDLLTTVPSPEPPSDKPETSEDLTELPSCESRPQRCSTPEKAEPPKVFGVQVRRRSSLCHLDEMNVSEECEDEIIASNDFEEYSEEEEDEETEDAHNNSFLSSFLTKIQQDDKYNCRIPMVDIFEQTPLSSFICYGCSGAYNTDNQFTINLKCQTMQIICSQCAWWTSRKIGSQKKEYQF